MKLLIIDDDIQIIDFIQNVALAQGYTDIDTETLGVEAITRVIQSDYDLITLDLQMPGIGGLEILPVIRDMCPHAVIAIVSGHIPERISPEVAGCADVILSKPVPVETFESLFESAARIGEEMERVRLLGMMPVTA